MLSKCRTCEHPVSTNASDCPNCGEYSPSPERYEDELQEQNDIVFLLIFLVGVFVFYFLVWLISV